MNEHVLVRKLGSFTIIKFLDKINKTKQRPTHDAGIPKNSDMPEELKKALAKNKVAKKNFEAFPPSAKRTIYRWILHAKLPETRKKRVILTINRTKEGKKVM